MLKVNRFMIEYANTIIKTLEEKRILSRGTNGMHTIKVLMQ